MIVSLLKYAVGTVRFKVTGDYPERFLNQLAAYRISFWDVGRSGNAIVLSIKATDYVKLRKIRGKNRIRTRVLKRSGLPFKIKKYRLRIGFLAGAVLFFAALWFLSGFVWNINVVGNSKLSEREIIDALRELGLYEGCRVSSVDAKLLKTRLALKLDGIAWASVNLEGTTATVNISEVLDTEKTDPIPCNLKASRDGIVKRLEVNEGTITVSVGQTVKAGDILVSGITEYKDGSHSLGRSSGRVYAETNRSLSYLATFVQTEKVYTKKPVKRSVLTVFGVDVPLYLGSLKGNFEPSTEVKQFGSGARRIPLKITETTFKEVDIRAFEIGTEVAVELAEAKLAEMEKEELKGAEILSKSVTSSICEKGVRITAEYTLLENIAEQDLLLIYDEK